MHKISLLNWNTLSLGAPAVPFNEKDENVEMRFVSIRYPKRQLILYLHGDVAETPTQADQEYGGTWAFYFRPQSSDLEGLERLEDLFHSENGQKILDEWGVPHLMATYEQRQALTDSHLLKIKLREYDGQWRFQCSSPMTLETVEQDLKKGTKVTLTVKPGFYFSETNNRYGLFYSLQELKFDDQVEVPKTPFKVLNNRQINGIVKKTKTK